MRTFERIKWFFLLTGSLNLLLNKTLLAEEVLEDVVVTATKQEIEAKMVPQPVNVIKKDDFERVGKRDTLRDLLLFEPGLLPTYHGGTDRRFTLRGLPSDKVLILKDGKRREGRPLKDFELDMLSLEDMERVEIVKGPASVLYGSDAIGGVINIITREPLKPSLSYSARYMVFDNGKSPEFKNVNFSAYTGRWHNFNLGIYGSYKDSEAYVQQKNFWELSPEREVKTGGVNLFYYLDKEGKNKLRLDYEKQDYEHLQIYPLLGRARKHYDFTEKENYALSFEGKIGEIGAKLRGYYTEAEVNIPRRALNGTLEDYDYGIRKLIVFEGHVTRKLFKDHRVLLGGEWRENEAKATRIETNVKRGFKYYEGRAYQLYGAKIKYYALYGQDEWFIGDKALVVLGLRYDDSDKLDSGLTPRVGITYTPFEGLRLKANYAKGFRNPDITQLYYRVRVPAHWIWGNPNLKSEKSDGLDLGIEKDLGKNGKIGLTFFYLEAKDFITTKFICRGDINQTCRTRTNETVPYDPRRGGTPYYEYANLEKAKFKGIELFGAFKFNEKFIGRITYTYLDAKDETNKERLEQRARHRAVGEATLKPFSPLRFSLVVEHTGDYLFAEENKNYTLWHFNFSFRANRFLELYGGVENLNDKKDLDLPLLGRAYFLGVRGRF